MPEGQEAEVVVVDAANAAYGQDGQGARLANLVALCRKLQEEGYEPIVLADAALRHAIDDRERYEELVAEGMVRQAPAGTDADYFILSFARELDARVVSNDRFRERADAFPDQAGNVIRYMIVAGEVVLEKRAGPREG